jgi:3-hydroxyisobutyrate dehydrogenase
MKLAVNTLFAIQVEALGEVLGMTRRAGVADTDAVEILSAMPVTSPALAGAGALRAARKFAPLFPVALVEKDLRYFVETAHALDTEAPAAATARSVFRRAIEAGYGEDNIVGVTKVFD